MKEWFPHDYNAASDAKIRSLIRRHCATGYGLYWHLVEMMHTEKAMHSSVAIDALIIGMNEDEDTVTAVLKTLQMLELVVANDNDVISIQRVTRNLSERESISERRAKAAGKRWRSDDKKPKTDANAEQMQSKCNANAMHVQCKSNANTIHNSTDKIVSNTIVRATTETPVVLWYLATNSNDMVAITAEQVKRWKELYPAVDVMQSLRNMAGWLEANPTRRKTKRGMLKFVNNWLQREQDKPNAQRTITQRANGDRAMGDGFDYAAEIVAERQRIQQQALPGPMVNRSLVAAEVRPEN